MSEEKKYCECFCHKPVHESVAVLDFACGCDLKECLVERDE